MHKTPGVFLNNTKPLNMKKFGIALIILGIVITVFSGITFKQEESIVEIGDVEVTREREREVNWPQWAGVVVVVAGAVIFLAGRRK
ncbi:MAG: hypothetical protein EA408_12500 [Marinilabiliales bacterium]|nr:MAG: hypothetical protein EA408_12500 [Marinilabiliales bacterium]